MLRILVLLVAVALLAPATADASRMPELPGITVERAACPHYAPEEGVVVSCADRARGILWLEPDARVGGWTYWHELGHFFDDRVLDDHTRAWFTTRLGFEQGTPWWGDGIGRDAVSPGEMFAHAYALCAKGTRRERASKRRICNAITIIALVRL